MINNKCIPLGQHFSPCGRHRPVKLQNICLSGQKLEMRQAFNNFFHIISTQRESHTIIDIQSVISLHSEKVDHSQHMEFSFLSLVPVSLNN